MKKLSANLLCVLILVGLIMFTATGLAFAQQKTPIAKEEKMQVFNELLSTYPADTQNEVRREFAGTVEKYLEFTYLKLASDKQTFLVVGNAMPFFGANKPYCWIYEKSGKKMRQLLDLELCEDVVPMKSKHKGYFDIRDTMGIGAAGNPFTRIFQFNGTKYQQSFSKNSRR